MSDSYDFSDLVREPSDREAPSAEVSVIEALHFYQAAEAAMRRRTGSAMGLGNNDLLALRFILDNKAAGRTTASKDVTRYLGISSASTTVLLQRLESSGYITRSASTVDRRSIEIVPTPQAEEGTGPMIAAAQRQIVSSTERLTTEEARIVTRFLTTMRDVVDQIGK
ncbi:hypothetical protein BH09ACT1_BH09ACT1_13110 [soil metagenome]